MNSKLRNFFFPEEERTKFDEQRYLKDLDEGVFRDRFVMGVSNANSGKWDIVDFAETPHAIFAGATGSGKSLGGAWTVGTHFCANSDIAMYFIMDIAKGAGDYSAMFKYPNVYTALNSNGYDALEGCHRITDLLYSESMARQDIFGEVGVPNLKAYEATTGKIMPRCVVIMEEFHMFPSAIEFEKNVDKKNSTANKLKTLLRVARSQGIFFIFASQRTTQVDVPKHIVSNILNKMMFKVPAGESQYVLGKMDAAFIKPNQKGRCVTENGTNQFPAFGALSKGKEAQEFIECMSTMCEAYYRPLAGQCARLNDKLIRDYLNGKDNKELYKNKKFSELADTLEMIKGELAIEVMHEAMGHGFKPVNTKTDKYGIFGVATKKNGEDFVCIYDKKGEATARTISNLVKAAKERGTLSGILYTPTSKTSPSLFKFAREMGILVFSLPEILKVCELLDNKRPQFADDYYEPIRLEDEEEEDDKRDDGPDIRRRNSLPPSSRILIPNVNRQFLDEDDAATEKAAALVDTSRRRMAKKTDAEIISDARRLEGVILARTMQKVIESDTIDDFAQTSPLEVFKKYTTKYIRSDHIDEALKAEVGIGALYKKISKANKEKADNKNKGE